MNIVATKAWTSEPELVQAVAAAYALEHTLLSARCERLVALLREHEIPLPDDDPRLGGSGGEHLERCRLVVIKAYELLGKADELEHALGELRRVVGSGVEMQQDSWVTS